VILTSASEEGLMKKTTLFIGCFYNVFGFDAKIIFKDKNKA